jgi:hypothetical protein
MICFNATNGAKVAVVQCNAKRRGLFDNIRALGTV